MDCRNPEAKDGIANQNPRYALPVTGFQHPCWNDSVFSKIVAVIEYFHSLFSYWLKKAKAF